MKTIKQTIESSGISPKLVRAVIKQLGGTDYIEDVAGNGASGGYCGFTYCVDTIAFFKKNKEEILEMVNNQAADFSESAADFIASFGCLKIKPDDSEGMREVYRALDGRVNKGDTQVANALAWFALEEVARAMCYC